MPTLTISLEPSPEVQRFFELLQRLPLAEPSEARGEAIERFLRLGDAAYELRRIDVVDGAAGAGELPFALDFSDRGVVLASACLAGDFDAV
jgi:hypothetical protein